MNSQETSSAQRDERHSVGSVHEAAPDHQDVRERPEGAGAEHERVEHLSYHTSVRPPGAGLLPVGSPVQQLLQR